MQPISNIVMLASFAHFNLSKRKVNRNGALFLFKLTSTLLFGTVFSLTQADEQCVSVYYPKTAAPYNAIFNEILDGIDSSVQWKVRGISINKDSIPEKLNNNCQANIGLGRVGITYLNTVQSDVPHVYGAVQVNPGTEVDAPTISLVPDPEELFIRLQHFAPHIKNIHVIYFPDQNANLVALASAKAKKLGLSVTSHEATDLKKALQLYRQVLSTLDPQTESVWITRSASVAETKAVLPIVLKQAWNRKLIVFSSQPAHAKRGVLFSVYPDNRKLGHTLGSLAYACAEGTKECMNSEVVPLTALKTAVNVRTAARLNLKVDRRKDPYVDLVFPEK